MIIVRRYLFGLVLGMAITMAAAAAPPTGVWSINANGHVGTMVLNVDIVGNVNGTLLGSQVKGLWTESARRLVLYRAINGTTFSTPPDLIQIYTGYMFPAAASNPTGPQRLAGEFQAFVGTGGSASRNVFGWFASK